MFQIPYFLPFESFVIPIESKGGTQCLFSLSFLNYNSFIGKQSLSIVFCLSLQTLTQNPVTLLILNIFQIMVFSSFCQIFIPLIQQNMQDLENRLIFKVSSPAKIILCGEHAVVYGQNALAMAINLRCMAQVYESNKLKQPILRLRSNTLNINNEFHALHYQQFKWGMNLNQYRQMVLKKYNIKDQNQVRFLYKICLFISGLSEKSLPNIAILNNKIPYSVIVNSEIPIGKCLGSSAAFNVIFSAILLELFGYEGWMQITTNDQKIKGEKTFTSEQLQAIFKLSLKLQSVEHGTPSGIDNYVSCYGGLVEYLGNQNNDQNNRYSKFCLLDRKISDNFLQEFKILLIDSLKEKNTREAVRIVREKVNSQQGQKYKGLISEIGNYSKEIILNLKQIKVDPKHKLNILKIASENHKILGLLGISNQEIEQIIKQFTIEGVMSGKITGAGMGGYVLVIMDIDGKIEISQNYKQRLIEGKIDQKGLNLIRY